MLTPTEHEMSQLAHLYDPSKAHDYYLRTRKLKGRRAGLGKQAVGFERANAQRSEAAKPKQRKELAQRIQNLEKKLKQLEALIRKKEHEEASENRKSKAKKERAAKEATKPKTAAEKAEAARDAKKFRDKNQQKLDTKAKNANNKSGGGSSPDNKSESKTASVSELKALATKVKGRIAVAKQKLAAL